MRKEYKREENYGAGEQTPIDPAEHGEAAGELDNGSPRIENHTEDEFTDTATVLTQNRGNAARAKVVDPVQRQSHRVFEHSASQSELNAFGDDRGIPTTPHVKRDADCRDEGYCHDGNHDFSRKLATRESIINDELGTGRGQKAQESSDCQADQDQRDRTPEWTQDSEKLGE
jgi:hypothetical protein